MPDMNIIINILSAAFAFMGSLILFIGVRRLIMTRSWRQAEGKVCDHARKLERDRDYARKKDSSLYYLYAPIYEYFADGKRYTVQSNIWTSKENWAARTVFYHPSNPENSALQSFPVLEIAGGLLFIAAAIACFFLHNYISP